VNKRVLREEVIPFRAGDGFELNLIHVNGATPPHKGPVLLVHGSTTRANLFRAPVAANIVDYLIAQGYDVWLENWRASIDLPRSSWYLDDAALHDHPRAVRKVLELTGSGSLKAIVHCQGSTSFFIALYAGLMPQVSTVVSNAVSTHPVVSVPAWLKLNIAPPLVGMMIDHVDAQWALHAPHLPGKVIAALTALTHHECDNAVCKMSSFMHGVGFPLMWSHDKLSDETHQWLSQEFAHVPVTFYRQIARSVNAGHLVAMGAHRELPATVVAEPPRTTARVAFITGAENRCFLPESQRRAHAHLSCHRPDYHTLRVIPGYGHLDVFLGKEAVRDVFPIILEELERAAPAPGL
jgi:pimeloyl-ACP methyl ester carboxylesterase